MERDILVDILLAAAPAVAELTRLALRVMLSARYIYYANRKLAFYINTINALLDVTAI